MSLFYYLFISAFAVEKKEKRNNDMTRWDDATAAKGLHIVTHDKTLTKQQRDVTECIFLL